MSYLYSIDGSTNILLTGDFNLPDVDWNTCEGNSSTSNAFIELVYDYNLTQIITGSTHANNILDVALTNHNNYHHVEILSNLPTGLSSDHYIITFSLAYYFDTPSKSFKHSYDYRLVNWDDVHKYLLNSFDFTPTYNSIDVEFIWEQLKAVIYSAISLYIPKISAKRSSQPN